MHGARSPAQEAGAGAKPAGCAGSTGARKARCYLSVEPASAPPVPATATTTCTVNESAGYTPCNLQGAYELTRLSARDGKGNTIAVVDPEDDPNAASDLNVYRSTYGLPPCTTGNGCFKKVNQDGVAGNYPAPDAGFAQEISLDLDMVSAICPHCHILLVEAASNGFGDLGTAVNEAVTLGAKVVSDSWGTGEFNGETGWDGNADHPGVAITFSSGDGAYQGGVQYPSASPYVTSVGGTELTPASNSRSWTETAWVTPGSPPTQGSGSGCSAYEPKPPWQHDSGCANRTTADLSAVAANVLSYDTYQASGWYYSFGTSVSSPIIAGAYGLANNPPSITIPASAAYSAPGCRPARHHQGQHRHLQPCLPVQGGQGLRRAHRPGHPARHRRLPGARHPGPEHLRCLLLRLGVRPLDHRHRSQLRRLPADRHAGDLPGRGHRRRLRVIGAVVQRHDSGLDGWPGW